MDTPRNVHRVPKKAWRKWTATGRATFNEVYEVLRDAWTNIVPPSLGKATKQARKVTAWNTAWIAADAATAAKLGPIHRAGLNAGA